jgi:hypothetical protein
MASSLSRVKWNLTRFGFTPGKLIQRMIRGDEPKILCVSISKSGTHLLERALCLHTRLYRKLIPTLHLNNIDDYGGFDTLMGVLRPGQILVSHLWYSPAYIEILHRHNVRCLLMIRDPRDVVLSMAFYISKQKKHFLHKMYASEPVLANRIKLAILDSEASRGLSIGQKLERFAGWLSSGALVVRFEDLVGIHGGGTQARQTAALRSIFAYLEMDFGEDEIDGYSRRLFTVESPTFRKGGIGQWREFFDDEIEEMYRQETDGWLSVYGY